MKGEEEAGITGETVHEFAGRSPRGATESTEERGEVNGRINEIRGVDVGIETGTLDFMVSAPRSFSMNLVLVVVAGTILTLAVGAFLDWRLWLLGLPIAITACVVGPLWGPNVIYEVDKAARRDARNLVYVYLTTIGMWWLAVFTAILAFKSTDFELWLIGLWGTIGKSDFNLGGWYFYVSGVILIATVLYVVWSKMRQGEVVHIPDPIYGVIPQTFNEKLLWVAVSLTAGIAAEIVFRGFLTFYLAWTIDIRPGVALVVSTFLYAAAYWYQGTKGMMIKLGTGAVFALLYWKTGSLMLPIILHTLMNLSVLLVKFPEEEPSNYGYSGEYIDPRSRY